MKKPLPPQLASLMKPKIPETDEEALQFVVEFAQRRPDAWKAVLLIHEIGDKHKVSSYLSSLGDDDAGKMSHIWLWLVDVYNVDEIEAARLKSINMYGGTYVEEQNVNQKYNHGQESG